jgi:hypothetical protein
MSGEREVRALEADKFMNEFKDSPEWKVENKNPFRWPHTFAAKCAAAFARRQVVEELRRLAGVTHGMGFKQPIAVEDWLRLRANEIEAEP